MKLLTRIIFLYGLIAASLCAIAYAKNETDIAYPVTGGNIYFDKATGTVTDCDETVTQAVIPAEIEGVSVHFIGYDDLFENSLGNQAFNNCVNLISVEIPESVTEIRDKAFACCALTSVIIPDSVTYLGHSAFWYCSNLTDVELSRSLTSIPREAFRYCYSLTSVKIPESVVSIGERAFSGSGLTRASISANISFIGKYAFLTSMRDVYYSGNKEQWERIYGINDSSLISDKITIHYNASMPDILAMSAPTVNGHVISAADLKGLTEISVPVTVSADTPTQVTLCVPFFDGGKFVGMGFVTANVDKTTQSVTVPVTGNVSGARKLNVIFLDADSVRCP